MTTATTTEQTAELARRVYTTIYNGTESFERIGHHIAYLLGSILTGSGFSLFRPLEESEDEFLLMLNDLFAEDDAVWAHITLECDQLGNGCTCPSCTKQLADCGI